MLPIKLIKSTFYHEKTTKQKLSDFIIQATQLSMGQKCSDFEHAFADWQGRGYCVLFNTGSSANLGLIQALVNLKVLKNDDRVAFSAITWSTNVMPLIQLGLVPIPVDVELTTLNCSLRLFRQAHENYRFKVFFITNLLGFASDIDAIQKYCAEQNILLLEDNCESLGSVVKGIRLGNFSLASTFSFFVGHHMSTIEGGAVCTNDKELDKELRMARSHGWDRHLQRDQQIELRSKEDVTDFYAKYTFYDLAYNLRPTEITGFLGLDQLQYLDEMIDKRQNNYFQFRKIFENNPYFFAQELEMDTISNFAMPLICKDKKILEKYIKKCNENQIEIRPIVGGLMTAQPFFKKYFHEIYQLPNAELIHNNGFYFGNNPELTEEEIIYLTQTFM